VIILMGVVHLAMVALSGSRITLNLGIALYLTLLEGALVTALLSFFASFTSPVLGSFFTIACVVAGHFSTDLLAFAQRFGGTVPRIVATGAYYVMPNLELLNARTEAVHNLALPQGFVLAVTLYALAYTAGLLYLATVIFRAREVS